MSISKTTPPANITTEAHRPPPIRPISVVESEPNISFVKSVVSLNPAQVHDEKHQSDAIEGVDALLEAEEQLNNANESSDNVTTVENEEYKTEPIITNEQDQNLEDIEDIDDKEDKEDKEGDVEMEGLNVDDKETSEPIESTNSKLCDSQISVTSNKSSSADRPGSKVNVNHDSVASIASISTPTT